MSFKNYPASQGFDLSREIKNGLKDEYDGPNPRRYMWAYNQSIYHNDKTNHPYLHLMDGGLSDNIGVHYITENFNHSSGFIFQRKPAIDEIVLIIANAKTQPPESIDKDEAPPNLIDVAYKTTVISMDNYSFESVQMISEIFKVSQRAAQSILECQAVLDKQCNSEYKLPKLGHDFKVTVIEVNFLNIKDPTKRDRFLILPTSFKLSRPQVDELISLGGELLDQSKTFNTLKSRLQ